MLDIRDPAFKLFGMTIPVAGDGQDSPRDSRDTSISSQPQEDAEKESSEEGSMEPEQPDDPSSPPAKEESSIPTPMSETDENQKESDSENQNQKAPDSDDMEANDPKNSQEKSLKKPDKILPCPRCSSMDTKFCYYNNYNVNQPRHFCKNCQRYWTAGGTMRNVPVGAGRRKNKTSATRYAQLSVSEALHAAGLDGVHHPNGTVLTFGSDRPLCESMASVLSIADNKVLNGTTRNGFHSISPAVHVPCQSRENGDERSSGSTVTTNSSKEDVAKGSEEPNNQTTLNGFSNQIPCFQWPFMWNPAAPHVPPFYPSGFPMPIYPAPYWNGAIPWNVSWVPPCSPGQKSPGSNPSSPTLGKHSREGDILNPNDGEKSSGTSTVLIPKTLRIDDPDEAAKSSIWTTLGIQKGQGDSTSKGGFFNSFQSSKLKENGHKIEVSPELKANPAALCRLVDLQERS